MLWKRLWLRWTTTRSPAKRNGPLAMDVSPSSAARTLKAKTLARLEKNQKRTTTFILLFALFCLQFYFHLQAANYEIILASQAYTAKSSAQNGIDSVKTNAAMMSRFVNKEAVDGKPYFVLKAGNGQVHKNEISKKKKKNLNFLKRWLACRRRTAPTRHVLVALTRWCATLPTRKLLIMLK